MHFSDILGEVSGISFQIDRYRPIIVFKSAYLVNYYDENVAILTSDINSLYTQLLEMKREAEVQSEVVYIKKTCADDWSEHEVVIEGTILDKLTSIKDHFKPIRRPKLLHYGYLSNRYGKIDNRYNVTTYVKRYGVSVKCKKTVVPLCRFDIKKELDEARAISAAFVGSVMEPLLIKAIRGAVDLSSLDRSISDGVQHMMKYGELADNDMVTRIKAALRKPTIIQYVKDVAKTLNLSSVTDETENGYFTLTKTFCLRSSPDLITADSVYDVKVTSTPLKEAQQLYLYARGFEQNYGPLKRCGTINLFTNELTLYEFEDLHREINDKPHITFNLSRHFDDKLSFHLGNALMQKDVPESKHDLSIVYCQGTLYGSVVKFHRYLKTREFVLNDPSTQFDAIWSHMGSDGKFYSINVRSEDTFEGTEPLTSPSDKTQKQMSRYALSMDKTDTDVDFMKKYNYERVYLLRSIPVPDSMKPYIMQYIDLDTWNYDDYEYPIEKELKDSLVGMYINMKHYKRLVQKDEKGNLYYVFGQKGTRMPITSLMMALDELFGYEPDSRSKRK